MGVLDEIKAITAPSWDWAWAWAELGKTSFPLMDYTEDDPSFKQFEIEQSYQILCQLQRHF